MKYLLQPKWTKTRIHIGKTGQFTNMWKLNNPLNNQWVKEEIIRNVRKF